MTAADDRPHDTAGRRVGVHVLGMHRSGTSATTRAINLLGVPTCVETDFMPGLKGNPRGHYESRTLVEINTRLLREQGCFWWSPPTPGALGSRSAKITDDEARAAFAAAHPTLQWVCKDPRSCLTLPFWRRVLDAKPVAIVVNRNPLEIAMSLQKRDRFEKRLGLAMWERYVRSALIHSEGLPVFLTHYDDLLDDPERWTTDIAAFLRGVGVDLDGQDASAVAASLESGLRHSRYTLAALRQDPDVSASQVALYQTLCEQTGATAVFEPPPLPPEEPSTEQILLAHNRRPRRVARRIGTHLRSTIERMPG